jgi:CheY-like chemotaxis protein
VIVATADSDVRRDVETALKDLDAASTRFCSTLQEATVALAEIDPDLLLIGEAFPDGEGSDLIVSLRHGGIGSNPFLPVVGLSLNPTAGSGRRLVVCGADMVTRLPPEAKRLRQEINALAEARRPFVVTSDYVGPDRRAGSDRQSAIPLLEVPNTLKVKAEGKEGSDLSAAIDAMMEEVNRQKLIRHGVQIAFLVDHAGPDLLIGDMSETAISCLEVLAELAEDVARRIENSDRAPLVGPFRQLAEMAVAMAERNSPPPTKETDRLIAMARALTAGLPQEVPMEPLVATAGRR